MDGTCLMNGVDQLKSPGANECAPYAPVLVRPCGLHTLHLHGALMAASGTPWAAWQTLAALAPLTSLRFDWFQLLTLVIRNTRWPFRLRAFFPKNTKLQEQNKTKTKKEMAS